MERLIDKFVDNILKTTKSFMIETENDTKKKYHFFIQSNVGKARYIYGTHFYDANFQTNIDLKPELVAIISDNSIYVIDEFELELYSVYMKNDIKLPENTYRINDIVDKENKNVKLNIFPNFYNSLEIIPITNNEMIEQCKTDARRNILTIKPPVNKIKIEPMFVKQDIANSLCGIVNLETEALNRLLKNKERWIARKTYHEKVKELMEDKSILEGYEIQIAEGLRSVEAKMVTVYFEMNGIKSYAKISPDTIINKMINRDYFCDFDFETVKWGAKLIKELNAAIWRGDKEKDILTCKHIDKITYGKKVLYIKEQ